MQKPVETYLSQKNNQRKRYKRDLFQQQDRICTTINYLKSSYSKFYLMNISFSVKNLQQHFKN